MKRNLICEKCKKYFVSHRSATKPIQRFCSLKCRGKLGGRKKLTEEQKIQNLKLNFEKHVIRKNGCWEWNGRLFSTGYPIMTILHKKGVQTGHRASWVIHKGKIPEGLFVCHTCDNKECTNPEHLFLGTHKENTLDMVTKNRQAIGIRNGCAKLSENDVIEIKKHLSLGNTYRELAEKFSVSTTNIAHIKNRKLWKHIQG
jgi:hypothetical protein